MMNERMMNERMLRNAGIALAASYSDIPPDGFGQPRFMEEAKSYGFLPTPVERVAVRVGMKIGWPVSAMTEDWRNRFTRSAGGVTQVCEHNILLLPQELHYRLDDVTREQSFVNTLCHEVGHVYARDHQNIFMFYPDCLHCSHAMEEAAVELAAMEAVERIFGVSNDKIALGYVANVFRQTMRDDSPNTYDIEVMHHVVEAGEKALRWYEPIVRASLRAEGVEHVGG